MDQINTHLPSANQILVYDEISNSFVNRDPNEVFTFSGIVGAENMGDTGIPVYSDTIDDKLRFRRLSAGNQIILRNMHSYIEIDFAGDASTLGGKSPTDFVLPENNLSEIDPDSARRTLSLYSIDQTHDVFMETNASNIPDEDNTYDLGSNGRRYADVFAVNFHGTATRALQAERLSRLDAEDGDVLIWSDQFNSWRPQTPKKVSFSDIEQVTKDKPRHGDILHFNGDNAQWEFIEYIPYESSDNGSIVAVNSVGNGVPILRSRVGDIIELRSLRASGNIEIEATAGNNEIAIRAIVPDTTDDLPEGNNNLYHTEERVVNTIKNTPLNTHSDVTNTSPDNGQGLIFINGIWVNKDVPYELYSTDDLDEGESNLYFTGDRVADALDTYISEGNLSLGDLSDTNVSDTNGTYLFYNGMNWISKNINSNDITEGNNKFFTEERVTSLIRDNITISDLSDTTVNSLSPSQVLIYNGESWVNQTIELAFPTFNNYRTVSKVSTSDINFEQASVHRIDGTTNTTLRLVGNTSPAVSLTVVICVEGYGGDITWQDTINWNNGSEPARGPNWTNYIMFWSGTRWFGMLSSRG